MKVPLLTVAKVRVPVTEATITHMPGVRLCPAPVTVAVVPKIVMLVMVKVTVAEALNHCTSLSSGLTAPSCRASPPHP